MGGTPNLSNNHLALNLLHISCCKKMVQVCIKRLELKGRSRVVMVRPNHCLERLHMLRFCPDKDLCVAFVVCSFLGCEKDLCLPTAKENLSAKFHRAELREPENLLITIIAMSSANKTSLEGLPYSDTICYTHESMSGSCCRSSQEMAMEPSRTSPIVGLCIAYMSQYHIWPRSFVLHCCVWFIPRLAAGRVPELPMVVVLSFKVNGLTSFLDELAESTEAESTEASGI